MAQLTVLDITQAGVNNTLAAAAGGGDTFADDGAGRTFFEVLNGGGGAVTVTFNFQLASQAVPGYGGSPAIPDLAVSVGAGERKLIGPFGRGFINSSGLVEVSYSGVSSVTVGARRLPRPAAGSL